MILKRLALGDLQTNCYLLADEETKECAVFDPADEAQKIFAAVCEYGLKIKYIILTHVHLDHVMALDEVKKHTGSPIVVHCHESDLLNDNNATLAPLFSSLPPESKTDISVADGDILYLGKKQVRLIHTPGHTPGGMCALCDDILISGDTIFAASIGRTDFPGGNYATLISSIKNKLMTLNDEIRVYPGHGPDTTIGYERANNPYL